MKSVIWRLNPMNINLQYDRLVQPKLVLITSLVSVLSYQAFFYMHPANQGWWNSPEFSILYTVKFVFINLTLIECISIYITFQLVRYYSRWLKINTTEYKARAILKLVGYYMPIALTAFFLYNPLTQSVRYVLNSFPMLSWEEYLNDYFYSTKLYLTYLPLSFFWVYLGVTFVLIKGYIDHTEKGDAPEYLKLFTQQGESLVPVKEILYIERKNRKSMVFTSEDHFSSRSTLNELEKHLPVGFIRINRAAIVRISEIKHYSYWENDKYILVLKRGNEFTISRQRLKTIKDSLIVI